MTRMTPIPRTGTDKNRWAQPVFIRCPGRFEWRGMLHSPEGRRQRFFKSAEERWELLMRGAAPTQAGQERADE
jgi:hypothetical protein